MLKEIFKEDWFIKYQKKHPLISLFLGYGPYPTTVLTKLGQDIITLEEIKGFKKLLTRLKDPEQYYGAYFEIEIASFLSKKYKVEIEPKIDNRKSDLKVKIEETPIFLELKTLRESKVERLVREIFNYLSKNLPKGYNFSIKFKKRFYELADAGRKLKFGNAKNFLIKQIDPDLKKIKQELGEGRLSGDFDLFCYKAAKGSEKGRSVTMRGDISINEVLRSTEAIREGMNQLPKDFPCFLLIKSLYLISKETKDLLEEFLREKAFENFVGLIFIRSLFTDEGMKYEKYLLFNPLTNNNFPYTNDVPKFLKYLQSL